MAIVTGQDGIRRRVQLGPDRERGTNVVTAMTDRELFERIISIGQVWPSRPYATVRQEIKEREEQRLWREFSRRLRREEWS